VKQHTVRIALGLALAVLAYRGKAWQQAELMLFNLQRLSPVAPLYSFYSQRVARYRADPPPPGWAA
jgi:adenylate cyclase